MKKTVLLLSALTALIACKESSNNQTKNNNLLWAETVQTLLPLERDTLWDKKDWEEAYKYDKEKIFNSITKAVSAGKLKAYMNYPGTALTTPEFNHILVQWDSTNTCEDPNNPGTFISAPMKMVQSAETLAQLRFNEKIEFDTVTYTVTKKVSSISFLAFKYNNIGEVMGYKKIFDVKLGDPVEEKKEK